MTRRAVTLAELVVAAGLVAMVAVPLIGMLTYSDHEAMTSEDYMVAEALALRHLDEVCATPWHELVTQLPIKRVTNEHRKFEVTLEARRVDEGLVAVDVQLVWAAKPGAAARRRYGLVRMRARPDQSIRTAYPFGDGTGR